MTAPHLAATAQAQAQACCSLSERPLSTTEAQQYAAVFAVLADPARLRLLSHIAEEGCRPMTVGELTAAMDLSQPTVSHHLKKLCEAGLLRKTRHGRSVTHEIQPDSFTQLRTILDLG